MKTNFLPRLHSKTLLWGSILLSASSCGAQTSASITVNGSSIIGTVPRFIFGQNLEAGDPYQIFSTDHGGYYGPKTGGGVWDPSTSAPTAVGLAAMDVGATVFRYPGGCGTHNFNWKQTIGPIASRPNYAFGIDECLKYCNTVGATVLMTISDYTGTSQDAADLVEYLNSPNDAAHPWAQKRAQNGHAAPYAVKFFEFGNESDHGNHQMQPHRQFTAAQYGNTFNDYCSKMKAVDPTIQLGSMMATGKLADDPWNDTVLSITKNNLSFVNVHRYAVGMDVESGSIPSDATTDRLMRGCMAQGEQFDYMLQRFRTKLNAATGRTVPMALTEYNALMITPNQAPIPYEFSLGAALFSADYLRILMQPGSQVMMANYWQLANGAFGLMQTDSDGVSVKKHAGYYLYNLWKAHFASQLLSTSVTSPRIAFEGFDFTNRVRPASGTTYTPEVVGTTNLVSTSMLSGSSGSGYTTQVMPDYSLKATLTNCTGDKFPMIAQLAGTPGQNYIVSFDARYTGTVGADTHLGIGLQDSRGFSVSQSAIGVEGAEANSAFTSFTGRYEVTPQTTGIDILWRLRTGTTPINGTLEIKNLKVVAWNVEKFPAYAAVTAVSSLSSDGKKLYLIIFNKHHSSAMNLTIKINNYNFNHAKRWTVTGPSLESTNMSAENVTMTQSGDWWLDPNANLVYSAPAHSMAAWEFDVSTAAH